MLVSLHDASKGFGEATIFSHLNLTIDENDRIGLIGPNGIGKSTLLHVLCAHLEPDEGEVYTKSNLTIGFLAQNAGLDRTGSVWDEMQSVFAPLLETEQQLRMLEQQIAAEGGESEALSSEYARLSSYFEQNDGYRIDVKIRTVLNGMGFEGIYDQRIESLSGGEKTRLALAKLLLEQPELLILDEPTNHLDFQTLIWLEEYLESYRGALLVVSHDRYFLDKTVSRIWEMEPKKIHEYRGNYSKYKLLRAERVEREQKAYEQQQEQIAAMKAYAEKNIVRASTSNSAKSRLHQIANMELLEPPYDTVNTPAFRFDFDREPVKEVLMAENITLSVGEGETSRTLCGNLDLTIRRGEKIALIGPNGVGKSTLLKSLLGILPCDGSIRWGRHVTLAYYDQENQNLNPDHTVLEELWSRYPNTPEQRIRTMLGRMCLRGENVYKKVSVVSGGERAKLGFAVMAAQRANTLLFDEPTNHLDLPSKEALEAALCRFEGTLLFVSHDRYFLNAIPTKIIELRPDGLRVYEGNYDFYREAKQREDASCAAQTVQKPNATEEPSAAKKNYTKSKQQRAADARRRNRIRELETLIAETESEIERLNADMTNPANAADYALLAEASNALTQRQHEHDGYLEEWLMLQEE